MFISIAIQSSIISCSYPNNIHSIRMIKTTAVITELHHSPSWEVVFVLVRPQETFSFLEGQFMMIQTDCFWQIVKKPYSIATTSKQLQEYKQLGFYVKKASEQWLSAWLTTQAKVWDTISLQWPVGHYCDNKDNGQYLFISTGSWLSPNLGLFQHLVYEWQSFSKIVNIFWERTSNHHVPSVMTLLDAHWSKNVTTINTLSQEQESTHNHWRVQQHIDKALKQFNDLQISVFLCWAPAMVKEVQQILMDKWIDKENITTEKR